MSAMQILERFKIWRERREHSQMDKWATTRKKGKSHYVAGYALYYCLGINLLFILTGYLLEEPINIAGVTIRLVLFFLVGLLIGNITWNSIEKRFLTGIGQSSSLGSTETS